MGKRRGLYGSMKANPNADWTIKDIERLCREEGIALKPPTSGSHYKAVSLLLAAHLTIPAKRPIKPVYIRELIGMIDAHREAVRGASK